jgi:hypothetical protein
MSIIIPIGGAQDLLESLLDDTDTWAHLYVVDTPLGPGTVTGDLHEASWPGYAPQRITTWTPPLPSGAWVYSTADLVLWVYPAGQPPVSVFGYWASDGQHGPLVWAERRAQGPIVLALPTDVALLLPRLTLRQDPAPQ